MSGLRRTRRRTRRRGRVARRHRHTLRHALLRLFPRRARGARIASSTRRSPTFRTSSATRVKANSNLGVLNLLGASGQRLRHRLRRRAGAGDRRRRRPGQDRLFRRRQDRCRNGAGAGAGDPLLQRRIGQRARASATRRRGAWANARRSVSASIPTSIRRRIPTSRPGSRKTSSAWPSTPRTRSTGMPPTLRHVDVRGIDMHIGSQITELGPHRRGRRARPSRWSTGSPPRAFAWSTSTSAAASASAIATRRRSIPTSTRWRSDALRGNRSLKVLLEPGRFLVGNAGVLLTRVTVSQAGRRKELRDRRRGHERPAASGALRRLARRARRCAARDTPSTVWQIVGPVCESADFLAHDRALALAEGDLLAIGSAGAYAMAMSSNYNSQTARRGGHRRRRNRASGAIARDHRGTLRARMLLP